MDFDIGQLKALAAVAAEGSFDAAARTLNVTPSAISQRIKSLEIQVGSVLLQRGKPVVVTEPGREVLLLARQMELLVSDATERLFGVSSSASIRRIPLAVNADSLSTWVLPALSSVSNGLTFDIRREDEDHSVELLRQGAVMGAITTAKSPVAGCTSVALGRMRYRPMAATRFKNRWFPDGLNADRMRVAPVVAFDRKDALQDTYARRFLKADLPSPRHYVPSSADFATAVAAGMGWGLIPELQSKNFAGAARLVDLDPEHHVDVTLYWQAWRLSSESLDRVTAAISAAAEAALI